MEMKEGPLKHVRADKFQYEERKIDPRTRNGLGETRSSSGIAELRILRLRLLWGLDARGCRLFRRCDIMPWWRRGSYATS